MRGKLVATILLISVFLTGCQEQEVGKGEDNNEISEESLTYYEDNQDKSEEPSEVLNTEESVEQVVEAYNGYINTVGNDFANLNYQCSFTGNSHGQTGRVTAQGDNVYFYELGYIYQMNKDGYKQIICPAEDASSLNIIGDTLYYLEGTQIYSVKINDGTKEELLIKVLAPFLVCDNCIYYVTSANISATRSEYFICEYKINANEPQRTVSLGEYIPTLVAINEEQNNSVIFYYEKEPYQDSNYNALHYDCYYLGSYNFDSGNMMGQEIIAPLYNCNAHFSAIPSDDYIYASWYCDKEFDRIILKVYCLDIMNLELITSKENSGYFIPVNSTGNNLVFKSASRLALVLSDAIQNPDYIGIIDEGTILSEETQISEVYIVDNYIYYTIKDYHSSNLYRIRIDGTGWEEV